MSLPSLISILEKTSGYFRDKGIESPRLNAELILCHLLNVRRLDLYLQFDRPITETELASLRPLVRERGDRKPLAYVTGTALFRHLKLKVGSGVLVPRQETEILAEKAIAKIKEMDAKNILDYGTGSGCLALSLCTETEAAHTVGIDASAKALEYAKTNALAAGVSPYRIEWLLGDLSSLSGRMFDLIISNPPYIPTDEIPGLQAEVLFEPREALDGGKDGLDYYRRLAQGALGLLNPCGWIYCEMGDGQGPAIQQIFKEKSNWQNIDIFDDLSGKRRVFQAQKA